MQDGVKHIIADAEDQIDKWKTTATIHTVAFVFFLILALQVSALWAILWFALVFWNGYKATTSWNNVATLKAVNNQNKDIQQELDKINEHWYNADGTMKQERIDEAIARMKEGEK